MKGFREWKFVALVSGQAGGLAGEVQLFFEVTRAGWRAGGQEMCYHESSGPSDLILSMQLWRKGVMGPRE